MVAAANQKDITVLSDDTGVFVPLLYYSRAQKLKPTDITESRKTVPKLASLSPTTEALTENIKQTHHQACVWKHTQDSDPPDMSPTDFLAHQIEIPLVFTHVRYFFLTYQRIQDRVIPM